MKAESEAAIDLMECDGEFPITDFEEVDLHDLLVFFITDRQRLAARRAEAVWPYSLITATGLSLTDLDFEVIVLRPADKQGRDRRAGPQDVQGLPQTEAGQRLASGADQDVTLFEHA